MPNASIWLQQDRAPPHFARGVRNYVDRTFPNRWIGRKWPIEWPPRSPDLTYLKNKVYKVKPGNIEDLKERIRHERQLTTPEVLENVKQEFNLR